MVNARVYVSRFIHWELVTALLHWWNVGRCFFFVSWGWERRQLSRL